MRRDLHDSLGPLLAALRLEIDGLGDADRTVRARGLVHEAIDEVRRISRDLRPSLLDDLGLADAIRRNAAALAASDGVDVSVDVEGIGPPLPNAVEVAALRVVSEALTNVVRHARATTCSVRVTVGDTVRIEVTDDGVGVAHATPGVGLRSMRERAAELGGSCDISSGARGGTVVTAVLPLTTEPA
jgi:signal transduction histidine kinase